MFKFQDGYRLPLAVCLLLSLLLLAGCSTTLPSGLEQPSDKLEPEPEQPPEPELPTAFMVMIDNHSSARPQHGLAQADLVYEIVCETGITRFLAVFHSQDPVRVGPIRSIRYYYLQTVKPYDIPLVHVGGNMDALALRTPLGIKSVCAITNEGSIFFTDSQRKSPHSTYTTSEAVVALAQKRGYPARGLPQLPLGEIPTAGSEVQRLDIKYSSRYTVNWVYQAAEGRYQRQLSGSPHLTAQQEPIFAQNIVIIEAPVKTVEVPVDGIQSEIKLIGKGKALFLRDGQLLSGTWQKDAANAHFKYLLDDGTEWTFAPGNLWVQQVPSLSRDVVYE